MRYVIKIAYDGTAYAGWQRQKNAISVQEKIEDGLRLALGVDVRVTASGRTDAGVHAAGQTAHFDLENCTVPPEKMPNLLNRFLPSDIRILEGRLAEDSFDCNRSAKKKTYRYSLYVSNYEMPLLERYAVRIERAAGLQKLQEIAACFEGEHDFKAFCASGSSVKTTVREVYEVKIEESQRYGNRTIDVYVTGNGFLYNMVRTLVGTLLDIAEGKRTKDSVSLAYQTGDRALLGKTMPAKGLTLMQVDYE